MSESCLATKCTSDNLGNGKYKAVQTTLAGVTPL